MSISLFDMFKIGIGPSSSHTVGPMRAAVMFAEGLRQDEVLTRVARVKAELFGSLGATGHGHGSATAVLLAGSDVDGDTLSFALASQPAHGTLSGTAPDLTYTPAQDYQGPDSFTFTVSDGQATSAPATVSIRVTAVNE